MADYSETPAWIALFIGLYSLAAGVGELRAPGMWARMVEDIERSPATLFLTGLFCLSLGAAIYLVSPWREGDWLSVVISVIGGLMVAEGMLLLAAGERFMGIWKSLIGKRMRVWAGLSALLGAAFIFVALSRLQTI
ncbi:hypothetical protein [Erythrobacter litoralis]|uniref:Uncharacterized protein n=1 Tax=Erythrobacter litoralis (strain HTCC2594) TaxID=314225 RepID=Q2N8D8_ERYLH|nr:hypothetical protein [Erythrobacter litoralis]ABC64053.1 hypothetical protein ELI_09805 [Erythrobacter litoralis HTCC2594]